MHSELVSLEPFLARFSSLNKKGRFFYGFLCTFPLLFLGYFLIVKSVFDAIFFHYSVFDSTDYDSKSNLGWFSHETFELRKWVTVPSHIYHIFVIQIVYKALIFI